MQTLSRSKLLLYKVISVIAVLFFVAFLRYCGAVQLFCAQNSSIFEISKVAFWALLIYGFFEFLIPGFAEQENIFLGKLAAIVSAPILITIFLLILPAGFTLALVSVALGVIISQIIEFSFAKIQPNCALILSVTVLFFLITLWFILFTYYPLGGILFQK